MGHLPTFPNLTGLELNAEFCVYLTGGLINLLEKSPKLGFLDFAQVYLQSISLQRNYFVYLFDFQRHLLNWFDWSSKFGFLLFRASTQIISMTMRFV